VAARRHRGAGLALYGRGSNPTRSEDMASKANGESLSQQLEDLREQAADLLAPEGRSRGGSTWPRRLAWVGLGVGIGAAAAGGRLLKMLPAQLVSRLEGVAGQVTSAASDLTGKLSTTVGSTGELAGDVADEGSDAGGQVIDVVTEDVSEPHT
jgi:hypothetical protein